VEQWSSGVVEGRLLLSASIIVFHTLHLDVLTVEVVGERTCLFITSQE
jgi:hypothetical protein